MQIGDRDTIKTLGINWAPRNDTFSFKMEENHTHVRTRLTKRQLASEILRLYDPLGLIQPIIINAKILFQELWKIAIDWDDPIPEEMASAWCKLRGELPALTEVEFPRQALRSKPFHLELHGFCDASTRAYGACIYLSHADEAGNVSTQLLCAKSRVTPIKEISLPRLELRGAVLLAELAQRIKLVFGDRIQSEHYWSDSTVALAWIKGPVERWKQYVRNRVMKIKELTSPEQWRHIVSEANPADMISRGISVRKFTTSKRDFWMHGPKYLKEGQAWSTAEPDLHTDEEARIIKTINIAQIAPEEDYLHQYKYHNKNPKTLRMAEASSQQFQEQIKISHGKRPDLHNQL